MPTALSTDLYEITMAAGYHAFGETGEGSFELWVRHLPPERGYLIAAGLDQALEYLEQLRFEPDEVEYLRHLPPLRTVPPSFFDEYLPHLRFSGEVWAVPEGTPVFAGEPLLRGDGVIAGSPAGRDGAAGHRSVSDDGRHQGQAGR